MLGAIIGDIVGSRFEFNNTDKIDFELFTSENGYTDDSICTIAIADAILKCIPYKNSVLAWCRKYSNPMGGYGASFAQWLHSDNPRPYNSYGNGAAMRVSPVGWAFDDEQTVIEQAIKTYEFSHNHPEGIKGAKCVADIIYLLRIQKISKDDVARYIKQSFGYDVPTIEKIKASHSFDETCQGTIPQAIRRFLDAGSFEEAIRLAVSIGGDSDTIAAIAGSIAESYYPIPEKIKSDAIKYLSDNMIDVIAQFYSEYSKALCNDRLFLFHHAFL